LFRGGLFAAACQLAGTCPAKMRARMETKRKAKFREGLRGSDLQPGRRATTEVPQRILEKDHSGREQLVWKEANGEAFCEGGRGPSPGIRSESTLKSIKDFRNSGERRDQSRMQKIFQSGDIWDKKIRVSGRSDRTTRSSSSGKEVKGCQDGVPRFLRVRKNRGAS